MDLFSFHITDFCYCICGWIVDLSSEEDTDMKMMPVKQMIIIVWVNTKMVSIVFQFNRPVNINSTARSLIELYQTDANI